MSALVGISGTEAASHLARLAGAHLTDQIEPDRFTLHDLLRAYASERAVDDLGEAERIGAIDRLNGWYLKHVDAAASALYPVLIRLPMPKIQSDANVSFEADVDAIEWLDRERPNLVAMIEAAGKSNQPDIAPHLLGGLRGYFSRRGHFSDWLLTATLVLDQAIVTGDLKAQAMAHMTLAHAHQARTSYYDAARHLREAAEASRASSWDEMEAVCLGNMAGIALEVGTTGEADMYRRRSLELSRAANYRRGEILALCNSGVVAELSGRVFDSLAELPAAIDLARKHGMKQLASSCSATLGSALHYAGRLDEAIDVYEDALRTKAEIGDHLGEALTLVGLAEVQRSRDEIDEAMCSALKALELGRGMGNVSLEMEALAATGSIRAASGQLEAALTDYNRANELADGLVGSRYVKNVVLLGRAAVRLACGEVDSALREAMQALASAELGEFRILEGRALTLIGRIEAIRGNRAEAMAHACAALENHRQTGYALGRAETETLLADLRG